MNNRWQISIAKNITWLTGSSLLVKPVWLIFVVVLCWRYLGTEGFGIFSTALWLAFIPAALTDLGITQLTVRDVAREKSAASTYLSSLLTFRLLASPLAWAAAYAAGLMLGYEGEILTALGWAALYAVSLQLLTYLRSFYKAFENLRLEGISIIAEKLLVVGLGGIALITLRTPSATLAGMAFGLVASVLLNLGWIALNLAPFDRKQIRPDFIRTALKSAVPLFLYSFSIVVYLRLGGVLLEYWHGEVEAGVFGAAFRIHEALFLLPAVFSAAVMPRLSALYHQDRLEDFRRVFRKSLGAALSLAILIAVLISFLAPTIIELANPNADHQAPATILSWLVWLLPLMTAKDLLIIGLVASDKQGFLAWLLGIAVVLSATLHFVLTKPYASMGIVAVFGIIESLVIIFATLRLNRTTRDADRESAATP